MSTAEAPAWTALARLVPFPDPPQAVIDALRVLADPAADTSLVEPPWDFANLSRRTSTHVAAWLALVVPWLNATYAWQPSWIIPPCWPAHPHLVAELAPLALTRVERFGPTSGSASHAQEFHDRLLPGFITRMNHALGASADDCRAGNHRPSPATVGDAAWRQAAAVWWSPPSTGLTGTRPNP